MPQDTPSASWGSVPATLLITILLEMPLYRGIFIGYRSVPYNITNIDMNHITSPDNSDSGIEREIQAKGLTAPRVTPVDIESNIASEYFFTASQGVIGAGNQVPFGSPLLLLTFCVLVLGNGFTVTGESACASPENFDAELGQKIARENAKQKLWPLMGYSLKQQLHESAQ